MSAAGTAAGEGTGAGERLGIPLVVLSAVVWSFGGTIALFLRGVDSWTVVFWRSLWAALFLLGFMLWRDGAAGTAALFRRMGPPGVAVGACFATAGTAFVVAVGLTTVASIVLIGAGVPLIAALMAFVLFGERVTGATALAIAAVLFGVAVMVSDSFSGGGSPAGNGLALLMAVAFALATVLTRRFTDVRMTPATCLGMGIAAAFAAAQAPALAVAPASFLILAGFGALNMGLGLALFASGARLVPAALAALLGTTETVLGPLWVWLVHGQVPAARTMLGGAIVFAALLVHLGFEARRQARARVPAGKPGTAGLPLPH